MLLLSLSLLFYVFFFKQKTAYEMRISDWSSDVCSSDLAVERAEAMRALRHLRRAHERSCAEQESAHIGLVGTVAIDFDRGATNELAARRRLDDIGHRPVERHAEIERERVGLARGQERPARPPLAERPRSRAAHGPPEASRGGKEVVR